MTRPDHEIDAYIEGTLTTEGARALDAWIATDPANASAFLHLVQTHQTLRIVGKENKLAREAADAEYIPLDALELESLVRMEAEADAHTVTLVGELPSKKAKDPNALSAREVVDTLGDALGLALTSKPAKKLYAYAAVAAAVLLAVVLLNPWSGSDTIDPNKPEALTKSTPRGPAVATLTATHNATWAEGALAPGSDLRTGTKLHPNQTLTLTAGFAEITTAQGAVAIIEAPATIELTDNDNALRLIHGKLVGICETESSKGFLVRTPHMDITDLGTRFGVDASLSDATEVYVFEGEVKVAMSSSDILETRQTHLTAGQAVRAESAAERLVTIDQDRARFAALAEDGGLVLPLGASDDGIAALSGAAAWSPGSTYIGTDFEQWPQHDKVMVFEELSAHRLTSQVPVTLRTPSSNTDLETTSPAIVIPAGTTVRSYILLLYPQTGGRYSGSVTFDGEVIGIATGGDAQNRALANQATDLIRFTNSFPWIEGSADAVALQNDRRTVSFEWGALSTTTTDAVRVFVRVPAGDQP